MKRAFSLVVLILVCCMGLAQTQQGIVKTRGRMVNGQLVAGTKLAGATITLSIGNPLVSGQNGAFSFNVPAGKNYSLVAAKKQGYTLADPEYTRRSFKYSANNPFYVVLEDENQRQADINAATRKVRKTLNAQLEKREKEIEALKAQNRLTEKEYQERLQQLYDNQSKSEQLVKEMAERYASTDYDQLDEFNQQVQMYIEEGELQKADSMIRSKGDMAQRVAEYHNVVAANQKARQQLEQSEAGAAKAYEDLSQDLFRRSEIFLQSYQQDSAMYCLKMRADLDTTNVSCNYDAANILCQQCFYIESFDYYERALRYVQGTWLRTAVLYSYGHALWLHGDILRANETFLQASSYDIRLDPKSPRYSESALAFSYNNLAVSSTNNEEFGRYAREALDLYKKLGDRYHIAINCNNVGVYYIRKGNYREGLKYYADAYALDKALHHEQPGNEDFLSSLAWMGWELGRTYLQIDSIQLAKYYLSESRSHYELLAKKNLNQYRDNLVKVDTELAKMYTILTLKDSALVCRERLDENLKILHERDPKKYKEYYYENLSSLLHLKGKTKECVALFKEELEKYETPTGRLLYSESNVPHSLRAHLRSHAVKENEIIDLAYFTDRLARLSVKDSLRADDNDWYMLGDAYFDLYSLYRTIGDLHTAAMYGEKSFQIYTRMSGNTKPCANMCRELLSLYANMDNWEKIDIYLDKSLSFYIDLDKLQPTVYISVVIELQNRKVLRLLENGKVDDAMELAKATYTMEKSDEQSKMILAICYYGKACEYANASDFVNAHAYIDKAISMSPDNADFYDSKGEILLMQGKNDEALAMWKKVLELNPDFLKEYPDGSNLSNGLKKLGLIE